MSLCGELISDCEMICNVLIEGQKPGGALITTVVLMLSDYSSYRWNYSTLLMTGDLSSGVPQAC